MGRARVEREEPRPDASAPTIMLRGDSCGRCARVSEVLRGGTRLEHPASRHRDTTNPSFDDATADVSGAWATDREISRAPGLLPYIWVDSIDATLAQVAMHGGVVVEAPHLDSPGGCWIATFHDPAGNTIGLYQEGPR